MEIWMEAQEYVKMTDPSHIFYKKKLFHLLGRNRFLDLGSGKKRENRKLCNADLRHFLVHKHTYKLRDCCDFSVTYKRRKRQISL